MGKAKKPLMTAAQVLAAIAGRHGEDLFVPECKDGPTQGANHLRLDAWAMRRSWTRPCFTGYEIKVSRSDWTGDQKWMAYAPLVNEMYLACPRGLIDPAEIPDGIGLLYASSTGGRCYAVKKAVWNPGDMASQFQVLQYVLMCRARIGRDRWNDQFEPPADRWRAWLERKQENRKIGHDVSKALREQYKREVEDVRRVQEDQGKNLQQVKLVLEEIEKLGVAFHRWEQPSHVASQVVEALKSGRSQREARAASVIEHAIKDLQRAKHHLETGNG